MGTDINLMVEVKRKGKWVDQKDELHMNNRSYRTFAFLGGVCNSFCVPPICEPKGLPDDSEYLNQEYKYQYTHHPYFGDKLPEENLPITIKYDKELDINNGSHSWLTLKELLDFDYSKEFENRAVHPVWKGNNSVMFGAIFTETAPEGQGKRTTYKEFLPETFFQDLETLKTLGNPEDVRIIFWFD